MISRIVNKGFIFLSLFYIINCNKHSKFPIHFYRENVTVEIKDHRASVMGVYYIKNLIKDSLSVDMNYPFIIDSYNYYPDTIILEYPYDTNGVLITFPMKFMAKEAKILKIYFSQRITQNNYTYITTTTHIWNRAIEQATFTIISPIDYMVKTNYKINNKKIINNKNVYLIKINNFYPDEDLKIEW